MKHLGFILSILFFAISSRGATIAVTTTTDDVPGCLREAIANASPGDTIVFQIPFDGAYDPATGYWTLSLMGDTPGRKTLVIDKNVTIDASAQNIILRRDPTAPADFRIFDIPSGVTVTLVRLWISNGNVTAAPSGGSNQDGGGIRNQGNLTIRDCYFTANTAGGVGGAILNSGGRLTVTRSTFSGNSSSQSGGGIYTTSLEQNTIDTCTFTGNNAADGGAIKNKQGKLFIRSCTISGNSATLAGGSSFGAGLVADTALQGSTHVENTIIAGNSSAQNPDVSGAVISDGHNVIGSPDGNSGFFGPGDQIGVTSAQVNLGALANFGGFTPVMKPGAGSVAIDQGKRTTDENGQLVSIDQRGLARPADRLEGNSASGDGTDVGAVELGFPQSGPKFTVNSNAERDNSECTSIDCTLLDALNAANAGADANTIAFAPGLPGSIMTTTLTPLGLPITNPVTIQGPGQDKMTILGVGGSRLFRVTSPDVTISGLNLYNGAILNEDGGAIHNTGGLTLINCQIDHGTAFHGKGGGVYNSPTGTLTLNGCTFTACLAEDGGGAICNDGIVTATNCTFDGNEAPRGGGLLTRANNGNSRSTLRNCTFTGNQGFSSNASATEGAGFFAEGAAGQHHIGNTLLAKNVANVNPDISGSCTSDGHNFIGNVGSASGFANNIMGDQVGAPGAAKDPLLGVLFDNGGPTSTVSISGTSPARDAGDDTLAPRSDQRGYNRNGTSDIGAFEFGGTIPVTLANVSTRLRVEAGDNALIGGFIVTGKQPKKVIVRAIGPSLQLSGKLVNPTLDLYQGSTLLASNDDWQNQPATDRQAVIDSTVAPINDLEPAIVRMLPANGTVYTAIVRGANSGTGVGVIEAYDLDRTSNSKLANISTRGFVQTGDNVLIAGTIVLGTSSQNVMIRAIGPSLPVTGKLEDPTLELRDGNGGLLEENDNWIESPNKQAITDSTIPPSNDAESAIVRTLTPAAYTAIVRGVNDTTGIAVVEVYALN
jgi:predicted outer membrane repeat protein